MCWTLVITLNAFSGYIETLPLRKCNPLSYLLHHMTAGLQQTNQGVAT